MHNLSFSAHGLLPNAFLGTTNLDLGSLTERFQTRFQSVRLQPPENEALAAFLARRWTVPIATTRMIAAEGSGRAEGRVIMKANPTSAGSA